VEHLEAVVAEASLAVAPLRARSRGERGRVQEEVHLSVVAKVGDEDLLHVWKQHRRVARVAREAGVGSIILGQFSAKVVVVDSTDLSFFQSPVAEIHTTVVAKVVVVDSTDLSFFQSPARCTTFDPWNTETLCVFASAVPLAVGSVSFIKDTSGSLATLVNVRIITPRAQASLRVATAFRQSSLAKFIALRLVWTSVDGDPVAITKKVEVSTRAPYYLFSDVCPQVTGRVCDQARRRK